MLGRDVLPTVYFPNMKSFIAFFSFCAILALAGCASSSPEEQQPPPLVPSVARVDTLSDLSAVLPGQTEEEPAETALPAQAEAWSPRFVQTGLASGIMVEFTGIKKGKTLQAKFANIELRRYLHDSVAAGAVPPVSGPMKAQTTINNLHQAFFKVQPGRYVFRLTNPWADRKMIRDVEVREGAYSVLVNDVYAAWLRRTRQSADSSAAKE